MKFCEYILNSSKVIERTRFCHGTTNYKLQRDVTQRVSIQELWFLHSARHLMLVNICVKFHEDTLNGFKATERRDFVLETATYKIQRDITQKV